MGASLPTDLSTDLDLRIVWLFAGCLQHVCLVTSIDWPLVVSRAIMHICCVLCALCVGQMTCVSVMVRCISVILFQPLVLIYQC